MKLKLLFVFLGALLFISSCVSMGVNKFSNAIYYVDYKLFSDKGMFLTESNTVPFDYTPIGSLYIEQKAGVASKSVKVEKTDKEARVYDELYGKQYEEKKEISKGDWIRPSADSILSSAYNFAKEQGADGILNLKLSVTFIGNRETFVLSGMLIKRK